MVGRIARKEFTEILRDGRFRLLGALVLTVAAVALGAGWRHYTDVQRQHEQAQRATRAQWLAQGEKNPHSAAHYGVYAFKPKSRLSLFDTGVDSYVGVAAWLEAHKQNEFKYRPAQDRTSLQRFGELTAAGTLLVLMPLFIILTTFSAFSGEREQGTLRTVLSLGVTPRVLAAGKAAGVGLSLALVLVPAAAMALAGLSLTSGFGDWRPDAGRALVLGVAFLTYFVTIAALALGVSARASSSRSALTVLLAFWFLNCLVAPRAAGDLAEAAHQTPTPVQFQRSMQAELDDRTELDARLARVRSELMHEYKAASIDAVPVNFRGISLQEGEEHGNEVFDTHYNRLYDIYDRQVRATRFAGLLAPAVPMRLLSMALAGTDMAHHRAFATSAEAYRRGIQRTLNADITSHTAANYVAGEDLWARIPSFAYEMPGLSAVTTTHRWDFVLLAAWLLGAVAFAVTGAARLAVD